MFTRVLIHRIGDDYAGRPSTSTQPGGEADAAAPKPSGLSKTAQKILRQQKQPAGPTLFLGNLGFETTEQSILDLFNGHRKAAGPKGPDVKSEDVNDDEKPAAKDRWIRKVRMGTFVDSGKCKGYVRHLGPVRTVLTWTASS